MRKIIIPIFIVLIFYSCISIAITSGDNSQTEQDAPEKQTDDDVETTLDIGE
jgi:hypothetical protein